MYATLPLPDIVINADDYNRVLLLAEKAIDDLPYVSAYLERELRRAEICDPWDPAGASMGQNVTFRVDDEPWLRMGRLSYPDSPTGPGGSVPILGPVGAALIGMKRNTTIEWFERDRVRTLTVLDHFW
ncbi:hypothetical protein [Pelagibacterium lacus]|uniref:Nucleoside diphosphate kinase regulator n=1 Tax=Pelagibacterium lacus TaxID=2282655 RepID=A0A369W4Z2_9HYPH|nr:hypothetical protein [Pelagibacterium lacus]RDE09628.1 hypothetical protein DVH29_05580 [Pelagibacterium lacus]